MYKSYIIGDNKRYSKSNYQPIRFFLNIELQEYLLLPGGGGGQVPWWCHVIYPKNFSTKGTKMQFAGGHCVISHHFHIVSRRFRAVSGHFHVILCCVASNGDTSHSNNICTFFCHLHEIDINLINISEFLIYIINFVSP